MIKDYNRQRLQVHKTYELGNFPRTVLYTQMNGTQLIDVQLLCIKIQYGIQSLNTPFWCLNILVLTPQNIFDGGRLNLIVTYIVNFFLIFFSGKKNNQKRQFEKHISFKFLKMAHVQCSSLFDLPFNISKKLTFVISIHDKLHCIVTVIITRSILTSFMYVFHFSTFSFNNSYYQVFTPNSIRLLA